MEINLDFKRQILPVRQYNNDFILEKINKIGLSYCKDFAVDNINKNQVQQLVYYFMNDEKFDGDLTKGLMLRGNIGTGKTILMRIFSEKKPGFNFTLTKNYLFHSVIDVYSEFVKNGYEGIEKYSKYTERDEILQNWINSICFDELGLESLNAKNYGNSINIMELIIAKRYNNWQQFGQLTHFTTNLTPDEIEKNYGERIRSRISEMCNDLIITGYDRRRR